MEIIISEGASEWPRVSLSQMDDSLALLHYHPLGQFPGWGNQTIGGSSYTQHLTLLEGYSSHINMTNLAKCQMGL